MVIATFGGGGYDDGNIDDLALQAINKYNKNENNYAMLLQQIKEASSPGVQSISAKDFPANELKKKFQLEKNDMGLLNIHFEKRKSDYYIVLGFIDSSKEEHPIGMNNHFKISNEHTFGLPMVVKGRWINEKLHIDYNRLCRIENYKFTITFKGDNLMELKLTEASKGINQTITGKTM